MKFKEVSNGVFTVNEFLSTEECKQWIQFSEETGYEMAKITIGKEQVLNQSVRNNERLIYESVELATELWERVKEFVPSETVYGRKYGLNERFRFYKYFPGQQFRLHQDGSFYRNIHEWSSYTFMVYLNEKMKGGATRFTNCSVQPETGKALIFKHELLHEGCPVLEGVKYVLRTDVMYRRKRK